MTRRGAALVAVLLLASSCDLEPIDLGSGRPLALRTTIAAADGTTLARIYKPAANRALVPIDRVPKVVQDAVLAAEDARFFEHPGYDVQSIARAALVNLREGRVVQGGSTITQQYVKNTYFRDPKKTIERKARELRIAIELERQHTKRQILGMYLNTAYMGEGAYGLKAASEVYFREGVQKLSLTDGALLAALIKAPAIYDPREHPRRAMARRNYVLDRMSDLGMIDSATARSAKESPLGISPRPPRLSIKEPYFVEAVKRQVLQEEGIAPTDSERANALYRGGLEIHSTLRPRLQDAAEDAIRTVLNQKGDPEAALVAIEPSTGHIVAMVGGRNWNRSQVNLALGAAGGGSGRQPGSSFKPIVAAAALESGISIDARYSGNPTAFVLPDDTTWTVNNAEGSGGGRLSVYEALVYSVNGVFARLGLEVGPNRVASQASLMGVTAKLPIYPSIALGASEVSVLDMATAFATIANKGEYIEPTTVSSVRLANGDTVKPDQESIPRVISPGNLYLLNEALQDVITRGTGRGAYIGRPAAGKTGTTDDHADAWFVGYTPDLVTAVWVGYPHARVPMTNVHGITVFGGTFPASIWRTFMLRALADVPPTEFDMPRGDIVTVKIDPRSGFLAAKWCRSEPRRMLRQFVPTAVCPPFEPRKKKDEGEDEKETKEEDKKDEPPPPEPSPTI